MLYQAICSLSVKMSRSHAELNIWKHRFLHSLSQLERLQTQSSRLLIAHDFSLLIFRNSPNENSIFHSDMAICFPGAKQDLLEYGIGYSAP